MPKLKIFYQQLLLIIFLTMNYLNNPITSYLPISWQEMKPLCQPGKQERIGLFGSDKN